MRQLKMRFAGPQEVEQIAEWLQATPNNLFDKDILGYPSLRVICSYNGEGPEAYLPSQRVLMLESLATKPGIEPMAAAQAFRDLVKGQELVASQEGVKELYFVCRDPNVIDVAKHHGFEVLEYPILRMKL